MAEQNSIWLRIGGSYTALKEALNSAYGEVKSFASRAREMMKSAGDSIAGEIGKGFAIANLATKGIGMVKEFVSTAIKHFGDLQDVASSVGMEAGGVEAFRVAISEAGGDVAKADLALVKYTENVMKAAAGDETAVKAFQKLGVSVLDKNGALRDTSAIMKDVADGLARMSSGADRLSAAGDIFGVKGGVKGGAVVGNALSGGSAGLDDAAKRAGAESINNLAAETKALDDATEKMWTRMKSVSGIVLTDIWNRTRMTFNDIGAVMDGMFFGGDGSAAYIDSLAKAEEALRNPEKVAGSDSVAQDIIKKSDAAAKATSAFEKYSAAQAEFALADKALRDNVGLSPEDQTRMGERRTAALQKVTEFQAAAQQKLDQIARGSEEAELAAQLKSLESDKERLELLRGLVTEQERLAASARKFSDEQIKATENAAKLSAQIKQVESSQLAANRAADKKLADATKNGLSGMLSDPSRIAYELQRMQKLRGIIDGRGSMDDKTRAKDELASVIQFLSSKAASLGDVDPAAASAKLDKATGKKGAGSFAEAKLAEDELANARLKAEARARIISELQNYAPGAFADMGRNVPRSIDAAATGGKTKIQIESEELRELLKTSKITSTDISKLVNGK